jgi:hypothetical protein
MIRFHPKAHVSRQLTAAGIGDSAALLAPPTPLAPPPAAPKLQRRRDSAAFPSPQSRFPGSNLSGMRPVRDSRPTVHRLFTHCFSVSCSLGPLSPPFCRRSPSVPTSRSPCFSPTPLSSGPTPLWPHPTPPPAPPFPAFLSPHSRGPDVPKSPLFTHPPPSIQTHPPCVFVKL